MVTLLEEDIVATVDSEDIAEVADTVQVTDSVVALASETSELAYY